ncbi:MAG: 1,4-alpha-glucan branching protein GlgB [Clostridiales bacterium]|jgi:1,4-alpha-glucan branching enzyme|nr:1,4-alpha-glucan branching protein GlgB [Clostridiales bacterium]
MLSTVNTTEILQTIGAQLADPHRILGMHEVAADGADKLFVRAFMPEAAKVDVLDPDTYRRFPLTKIHADGFYEGEITGRSTWFRYLLEAEFENGSVFRTYDPYSFAPVLTDFDMFLFGQGTHYKIADKLGANMMTVDGVDGVLFAVWAPNAARVSVIGSFNNYDGRRHAMRLRQPNGIWELFVPGLSQYDRYKFEIKTRDGVLLQKSDPYAKFYELRPSTNSLIYDIGNYKWNDAQWLARRNAGPHPLNGPINIYEVNLGSWKKNPDNIREGDDSGGFMTYIEAAHEIVPYAGEMGYTHIELMPVQEHPFDGSWGYQVTGYYAPTSRHGSPDEFKYFVDYCHRHGLGVILDWVPAHFPKDAHGLEKFDGTALYEHEDPRQGEHPDWGTLVFNYGRQEVKNFLIANALFWIEEYHLDGLRVDAVASMLHLNYSKNDGGWIANKYGGNINLDAVEFIKHMNSVVLGAYPHVLMIAEESTSYEGVSRNVDHGGLGFSLKWNMGWMNDFLAYVERDPIYRRYHHNFLTFGIMYAYTENFVLVLSHDEVVHGKKSLVNKMPGDLWQKFANLRVALGFMYGHPGKKLLFMGGEFGQFIEWDEKRPLDWFLLEYDHHRQMQDFTRDLNHLYKNQRACWFDDFAPRGFSWVDVHDNARSIISFARFSDNPAETLIFICNFTPNPVEEHRVGLHHVSDYTEILNSDDPKYGGSGVVNTHVLKPAEIFCNNQQYSVGLRLPPLGVVVLRACN